MSTSNEMVIIDLLKSDCLNIQFRILVVNGYQLYQTVAMAHGQDPVSFQKHAYVMKITLMTSLKDM